MKDTVDQYWTCVLCPDKRVVGYDINQGKLVYFELNNVKGWYPVCQPCMDRKGYS